MSPLAPPQLFFLTSSQIPLPLIQTGDPPLTSIWDRRIKGGLKPPQNTNNSPGAPRPPQGPDGAQASEPAPCWGQRALSHSHQRAGERAPQLLPSVTACSCHV